MLILYNTVTSDGRSFSPYCWRVKMALAHKALDYTTENCRFSELSSKISEKLSLQDEMPPILVETDSNTKIPESMAIAAYLESQYPTNGLGSLYTCPNSTQSLQESKETAERLNNHLEEHGGCIFDVIASDIGRLLDDADRQVFLQKRAKRLQGADLDEFTRNNRYKPDARSKIKELLDPFRTLLGNKPFLLGDGPTLSDYILFGHLQWSRAVSPYILFGEDDVLFAWRERMLSLFNDLGRNNPGYPLIPC